MLDVLLDAVGGSADKFSLPIEFNTNSLWIGVALVAVAAVFFLFLYVRYQRSVTQGDVDREELLIRAGQQDLKRMRLDAWGNVRPSLFQPQPQPTSKDEDSESVEEKKGSIGEQLIETVTSGRLVHLLNNFHVKTQKMAKRFEPTLTMEQRLEQERRARLADDSVNPLYPLRVKQKQMEEKRNTSSARKESQDVEDVDLDDEQDEMERFDADDRIESDHETCTKHSES